MKDISDIDLVREAIEAQKNSYSPYSQFPVGVALVTSDGKKFRGCNIENASYAVPSSCAERTAICSAISYGRKEFKKLAVVGGDLSDYCWPCGVCRQIMNEFSPEMDVISGKLVNGKLKIQKVKLTELLPKAFGPQNLK